MYTPSWCRSFSPHVGRHFPRNCTTPHFTCFPRHVPPKVSNVCLHAYNLVENFNAFLFVCHSENIPSHWVGNSLQVSSHSPHWHHAGEFLPARKVTTCLRTSTHREVNGEKRTRVACVKGKCIQKANASHSLPYVHCMFHLVICHTHCFTKNATEMSKMFCFKNFPLFQKSLTTHLHPSSHPCPPTHHCMRE